MSSSYVPSCIPPSERDDPALWFAFSDGQVAVCAGSGDACLPCCVHLTDYGLEPQRTQYLGTYDGRHCYAVELGKSGALPKDWKLIGLRDAFSVLDGGLAALSGRAFQLLEWERNHHYCSRCASPMAQRPCERSRVCPECRFTSYPPVSPAIMVLITDGARRVLLARKPSWAAGRFSAIAGFVEPGETLEDAVARETREEVGVEVRNIRYFGSQPWPFPHSLMVAFTAEYAGGEVRPDGTEIEEARWFDADQLPALPGSISISRRLIDAVSAELAGKRTRD